MKKIYFHTSDIFYSSFLHHQESYDFLDIVQVMKVVVLELNIYLLLIHKFQNNQELKDDDQGV